MTANGMPGQRSPIETHPDKALFFGDPQSQGALYRGVSISSAAVDAGTTNRDLRKGLLLGRVSANAYVEWDPDASDGREVLRGILPEDLALADLNGIVSDKHRSILIAGRVRSDALLVLGTPLLTSSHLAAAVTAMEGLGFVLSHRALA